MFVSMFDWPINTSDNTCTTNPNCPRHYHYVITARRYGTVNRRNPVIFLDPRYLKSH